MRAMNPGRATLSLILVLLLLFVFLYKRWQEPRRGEAFDRHPARLSYTRHALCRMDCRHINPDEIRDILENGVINYNKSNRNGRPCPSFAVQGHTERGAHLRVVFAQCAGETRVVTCYNLDRQFECHCPGDEKKN